MKIFFVELRNRIVFLALTFLSVFTITFYYKDLLLFLLLTPKIKPVIYYLNYFILTSITELFYVYINVSWTVSCYILYIFTLYQSISGLSGGLYRKEYEYLKSFFFLAMVLVFLSNNFFFHTLLPLTNYFFFNIQENSIEFTEFYFEPRLKSYFNFYKNLYFGCFLGFQFCLFYFIIQEYLTKNLNVLKKYRKFLYFFALCFATVASPPDILNQIFMFSSLVFLLELLVLWHLVQKNLIW